MTQKVRWKEKRERERGDKNNIALHYNIKMQYNGNQLRAENIILICACYNNNNINWEYNLHNIITNSLLFLISSLFGFLFLFLEYLFTLFQLKPWKGKKEEKW